MIDRDSNDAAAIRDELRGFIERAIADEGSGMDSGGGMGAADLWFKVGGREYCLTIRPSIPSPSLPISTANWPKLPG